MLGYIKRQIPDRLVQGVSLHLTQLSFEECWPRRVQKVWPQWLFWPWPQLWTSQSRLVGHFDQLEPRTTIWTGPQAEQRTGLCLPQEKVLTKIYLLLLIHEGSNRL